MSEFKSSGEFATTWFGGLGLIQGEEIVRYRDCKYATKRWTPAHREEVTYCERFVHLAGYNQSAYVEPDGFCAWGERKVDA